MKALKKMKKRGFLLQTVKAKKQGFYFFANFRELKNKDFIFFTNFESEKTRNLYFFFANFRKLKKQGFLYLK